MIVFRCDRFRCGVFCFCVVSEIVMVVLSVSFVVLVVLVLCRC